jgi:ribosome-binding protein aMBF1 (putative translation factor)
LTSPRPFNLVTMSQDWASIVIGKAAAKGSSQGPKVAGTNTLQKVTTTAASSARALDAATDVGKRKELTSESRQAIMSARAANKWTQVELNQRCSFPANTIRDVESGRLTPNQNQISILQRILKIQLKLS